MKQMSPVGPGHLKRLCPTLFLALGLFALAVSGCRSSGKAGPSGFASVELRGNTPGQIRDVTVEVFSGHGYKVTSPALTGMVFEKQASRMNNAAYGNWTGSPVWIRVSASIVPVSEAAYRLQCKAVLLRDKGQAAFEEEIKLKGFQSGPYQKLLDEVASRLTGKTPIPN